jgi:ParB/RepB/Spo0J family partition protein
MNFSPQEFLPIDLDQIDFEDCLTNFSLSQAPEELEESIRTVGIIHPVGLARKSEGYRIVCGHRRLNIAKKLKFSSVSAFIININLADEELISFNLQENRSHRQYGDIEKGGILAILKKSGVEDDRLVQEYMPLVGLEKSKKLLNDFLQTSRLSHGFQKLLHDLNVSLRIANVICGWSKESRDSAEVLFSILRPGVNKWRDLLELLDETALREKLEPCEIIQWTPLQAILEQTHLTPGQKYDSIVQSLHPRRYPLLSELNKKIAGALDRLDLHPDTLVKTHKNFENDEVRIEMKFRNVSELKGQLLRLTPAVDSPAMQELVDTLRNLD